MRLIVLMFKTLVEMLSNASRIRGLSSRFGNGVLMSIMHPQILTQILTK